MYLDHFGLAVNPFGLSPKLDFLYKSETFEESMAHLIYGLESQEAIVLITGSIGTGKTMALQSFLINLGPRFEFALITNTRLTSVELLKLILDDLGVKVPPGCDKSDLLIQFKNYLLNASAEGKRVLIVVDEAQNLSSEVLEEIRLLTNLGQGESQPVQIILVGQPELEEAVNRPDLAQLRQRIRVHYSMDPLSRKEIEEYINHRMRVAGCETPAFTSGAIDIIYRVSHGVPRLVNTMAGEGLLSAFVAGHTKVEAEDIDQDKDLSFESGAVPLPSPPPAAAVVPEPVPPAGPTYAAPPPPVPSAPPAPQAPPAPSQAPRESSAPKPTAKVEIPARRKSGPGRALWGWVAAAVVILAVGSLYFMGYLDGMIGSISRAEQAAIPVEIATSEPEVALSPEMDQNRASEPDDTPVPEKPDETPVEADQPADPAPKTTGAVTLEAEEPVAKQTAAAEGIIYLHVSSFRARGMADSLKKRMIGEGVNAVVLEVEVRGEDWNRVYLGPYANREAAYTDGIKMKQDGRISFFRLTEIDPDELQGQ